jgi:putative transposase
MKLTYKFRIKDSNAKKQLALWANTVNFVWNHCKELSTEEYKTKGKTLSGFDLNNKNSGRSKELGIPAQTIQAIGEQFALSAKQHKKIPKWRSYKHSLGWIPWKATSFRMNDDTIRFNKQFFRVWKSRTLKGSVKTGSFVQDTRGHWYVCIVCEVPQEPIAPKHTRVGLDLGMKTHITGSTGAQYNRPNTTRKYEERLATAQRANKKRTTTKIHNKIKNIRKDWIHKTTTEIVKLFDTIIVGQVITKQIQKKKPSGFNKNLYDASWFQLKTTLEYKARMLGGNYVEINEAYTTQTCSRCGSRSGPKGTKGLSQRGWKCSECGSFHDRDVNAAQNILLRGLRAISVRRTPIGASIAGPRP